MRGTPQQAAWFAEVWPGFWRKRPGRKDALRAFARHVKTERDYRLLVTAIERDRQVYLSWDEDKRPYFSTYLNREEWQETPESLAVLTKAPARQAKTPEDVMAEALASDSVFEWSRPRTESNGRAA
jgi:hypothetical protein